MVPFAGYQMPLQYPGGIIKEHLHTRAQAGLFDVSHMGQVTIHGGDAATALETLVPIDVAGLGVGRQRYGFFTNEAGGILDDLMISNLNDRLFLVVNAARKALDIDHLNQHLPAGCSVEVVHDRALLALQGPEAIRVVARFAPEVAALGFMQCAQFTIGGFNCLVSRSGYSGEDGCEISLPAAYASDFAEQLLEQEEVSPAGLGARDTLRLEAGLCLYGQDLDVETTPVEAGLGWAIQRVRRIGGQREGGFPGAPKILSQLVEGPPRKRVGIRPEGRAPIRQGTPIFRDDTEVGRVTSGGFGPSVNGPVAMGYIEATALKDEGAFSALLRGKPVAVKIDKLPFVPHGYHKKQ